MKETTESGFYHFNSILPIGCRNGEPNMGSSNGNVAGAKSADRERAEKRTRDKAKRKRKCAETGTEKTPNEILEWNGERYGEKTHAHKAEELKFITSSKK